MREPKRGRSLSVRFPAISASKKRQWADPKFWEKMSASHRGATVVHSEETRRKISNTLKLRYDDITKTAGWKGGISKVHGYKRRKKAEYELRIKDCDGLHSAGEWELLKLQHGYRCPACGQQEPDIVLTQDHIVPLSQGGSDWIENIQPLCKSCNSKKHIQSVFYPVWVDTN